MERQRLKWLPATTPAQEDMFLFDAKSGLQLHGRLQPRLPSVRPRLQEDITKVRHLAALPKADVRLLMDAQPNVMYVRVPASPDVVGSVASWDAFRARFALPVADTVPCPFRHAVKGGAFPWSMAIPADATPPCTEDIVPAGDAAASSNSGLPAEGRLPEVGISRADKLLANILDAARSGNLQLVQHQCNAVRDMLTVPELRTARAAAQMRRSNADGADNAESQPQPPRKPGGLMYRPHVMLHAVLTCDYVKDPAKLLEVVQWSLGTSAGAVSEVTGISCYLDCWKVRFQFQDRGPWMLRATQTYIHQKANT